MMLDGLIPPIHFFQLLFSAYALRQSYHSITQVQQYESKAKKVAQYSNTAERQLWKTRSTEASGAGASLLSALTALYLFVSALRTPTTDASFTSLIVLSIVNVGTTLFARQHIAQFWRGKAKVPFVDGYNDAISREAELQTVLAIMAGLWGLLFGIMVLAARYI